MKNIFVALCLVFVSWGASAHGEDVYGPHQGFVRMPGAFHTEVVLDGKNKLKVYLLDIEWKNPSTSQSSVQVSYNGQKKVDCIPEINFFLCQFPSSVDLNKKATLKVAAVREQQKGMEVVYKLPLKLEKNKPEMKMDHGSHK